MPWSSDDLVSQIGSIGQRIDDLDASGQNGIQRDDVRPGLVDTHLSLVQELVECEDRSKSTGKVATC